MQDSIGAGIIIVLLLLIASAGFSGSEAALFSLQPGRVKEFARRRRFKNIFRVLFEKPVEVLILIIFCNNVVNIFASAIMASIIISTMGDEWKFLSIAIMSPLLLVFGDVIPKVAAVNSAEKFSQVVAAPLELIYRIFLPVILIFKRATLFFSSFFSAGVQRDDSKLEMAEDVRVYLEIGEESGTLDASEKKLIENVFILNELPVWEVMRHRREMFYVNYNTPKEKLIEEIKKRGFTKIPVVKDSVDNIVGVLHVKDLLLASRRGELDNWQDFLRKPEFVYRNKRVNTLLKEMKERNFTICFLVNEYGKVIGLLTMTDILQMIFKGFEMGTEFPGWLSEQLEDGSFLVSPRMHLELFNEFFNAGLPASNHRTIGRFLKALINRNPVPGDSAEYGKWIFKVESSKDKKSIILKVKEKGDG